MELLLFITGPSWSHNLPRVQIFSWTTMLGKLPTCGMMQKRCNSCALCPNWCVLCRKEMKIMIICLFIAFTSCLRFRLQSFGGYDYGLGSSKIYALTICCRSWMRLWQEWYSFLDGDSSFYLLVSMVGAE